MKSTGIVRKVDELGRIVLPIELRRTYDLAVKDAIEIYTEDDKIILKKFQRSCIFCGSSENLIDYKDRTVCANCITELKGAAK
ncbi:MAG: AbrB/MazE/SpoVT family DNA-binding domain-containing protein [Ruminococcus sp.]|nr:AbrB/MazE/SpoVT family DNA-binding domain-containing protein [Ruminococcus sp.]